MSKQHLLRLSVASGLAMMALFVTVSRRDLQPPAETRPLSSSRILGEAPPTAAALSGSVDGTAAQPAPSNCRGNVAFLAWIQDFRSTGIANAETLAQGVRLAGTRRAALKKLIAQDPEAALAVALPASARVGLPPEVVAQLEEPIEAVGSLRAIQVCHFPEAASPAPARILQTLEVDGRFYRAFPTGRSESLVNQPALAVNAVAVDGWAAVRASRLGVSAKSGPVPQAAASTGAIRILFVRVDFSDLPGVPRAGYTPEVGFSDRDIDPQLIDSAINGAGGIRQFFEDSSYGKTTLQVGQADVTPVLRVPNTALSYATADPATSIYSLHNHAEQAALAAGWPTQQYDRIAVVWSNLGPLPGSRIGYFGGLGEIGGRRLWFQGYFAPSAIAHEIGHTYGFHHANRWKTSDGTVTGSGTSAEYGDPSDQMGGGAYGGLNPWYRQRAGWLPESAILTPRTPGLVRLQRFDRPGADLNATLALRIADPTASTSQRRDFWLALRGARFARGGDLAGTGYLFWGYQNPRESQLLDTRTPGNDDGTDAGLRVDEVFHERGLALRPIATGGSPGSEFLDVQILALPGNPGYGPARSLVRAVQSSVLVSEADGAARLEFERLDGTSVELRLTASTRDGTARAETDYQATSVTLAWASGDGSRKSLSIPLRANPAASGSRAFGVDLSNVVGGTLAGDASLSVTIAKAGATDPSWGRAATAISPTNLVPLPDGGCVGLRQFYNYELARYQVRVLRYAADGSEVAGFAPTAFEISSSYRMARQADGRLLLTFGTGGSDREVRLARLREDGSVDSTFVSTALGRFARINMIAPLPDGRILLAGYDFLLESGEQTGLALRLRADGTLDPTFLRPASPVFDGFGQSNSVQPAARWQNPARGRLPLSSRQPDLLGPGAAAPRRRSRCRIHASSLWSQQQRSALFDRRRW